MKATLKELREIATFIEDSNNEFLIAMRGLMQDRVVEPIRQGIFEDTADHMASGHFFKSKEDILTGFYFLEQIDADFSEVVEIEL